MKLTEKELRDILKSCKGYKGDILRVPVKITNTDDCKKEYYVEPLCEEKTIMENNPSIVNTQVESQAVKEIDELCTGKPCTPVHDNSASDAYNKLSESEQQEIKHLIKRSEEIKNIINLKKQNNEPQCWLDFETGSTNTVRDDKLLEEWKKYKEQVNAFTKKHPKLPKMIVNAMLLDEYPEDNGSGLDEFQKITEQMHKTYLKKNKDYGNSFDELFDEFGITSALLRIKDKYNRLKSITANNKIEVEDETVEDTLLDMANYAILTVLKLRNTQKK